VATKHAVKLAKSVQLLRGEETFVGKDRIQRKAAVPFAQNAPITIGPPWICRIESKDVVVQNTERFDERECGAQMAALATIQTAHYEAAQCERALVEAVTD
jgi:hypothetical protein